MCWPPYPFFLWSCSLLSIRRSQTSWLGSFIGLLRTGTGHLIHSVCEAVLYYLSEDLKQAGWDPLSSSWEQVLATLSILFVKLFYIIYQKISNKLVGILHRARKNRYCPPYPFDLWSCSIIYQKISNKLVGIFHRARKNRYWLPYPFCLRSCSIIYQKISNKLVGTLHRARKNRYLLPYPFCLWSCSMLSIRRSQTSWLGSFIEVVHVRTGTAHLIHFVCELFYIIYQKISNKLVGILHRARKNRYCPPYPFCLWSCSILFIRRFQTSLHASFIGHARTDTACPCPFC